MVMGTGYNPRIVTENLVFCVDVANIRSYPKTGTTLYDLKGANNSSIINGAYYDSSNIGNFTFDGANDYIQLSQDISSSMYSGYTMNIIMSKAASGSEYHVFNQWGQAGTGNASWTVFTTTDNKIRMFHYGPQGTKYVESSSTFEINTIYNIVFTWNGTLNSNGFKIYIDGALDISSTMTGSLQISTNYDPVFGHEAFSNTLDFNGKIYLTSLYNRALTADEVRQNYEATVGRFT